MANPVPSQGGEPTEVRVPPEITVASSRRAPELEPTLQLSPSSLSAMAPGELPSGTRSGETPSQVRSSGNVVDLLTRTNPIAFDTSIDLMPERLSLGYQRSRLAWWCSRALLTLCLGALIGVPPAVMEIWWWTGRRAGRFADGPQLPGPVASSGEIAPVIAPSARVATPRPQTPRALVSPTGL